MKPVTQNFAQVLASGQNSRVGAARSYAVTGGQKIGIWSYNGAGIVAVPRTGGFAVITKDKANASEFAIKGGDWLRNAGFDGTGFLSDVGLSGTPSQNDIDLYNSAMGVSTTLPAINLGTNIIASGTTSTSTTTAAATQGFLSTTTGKIVAGITAVVVTVGLWFVFKKK